MTASAASAVRSLGVLAPSQSQSKSKSTDDATAFQQSLSQYLQNITSGAGGPTGANPK